jgi:hypothetical protein
MEVDTARAVEAGATDTVLATVTIEWIASGDPTSWSASTITSIEDDSGNPISAVAQSGAIYVGGGVVLTKPAMDITNNSATFVGTLATGFEDDVWFEYGLSPDALTLATDVTHNLTGDSGTNYTKSMPGTVIFRGQTYYYKMASRHNGNGSVLSLTIPVNNSMYLPQVFEPEQTRYEQFQDADFNFTKMAGVMSEGYTNVWGIYFYGLLFIGVFGAYWLRHEDITLPLFLYILLSFTIYDYIPADWRIFIWLSVGIGLAGIVYTLFRNRRN